jgi:hypothetical protein
MATGWGDALCSPAVGGMPRGCAGAAAHCGCRGTSGSAGGTASVPGDVSATARGVAHVVS